MGNSINQSLKPRIYVACLAAYNNGHLHGAWIDAAQEPWTIYDAVQDTLCASPIAGAEEWAIHDYEGFGEVRVEEYDPFDRVSALALFIVTHGEVGAALLNYFRGDLTEANQAMADRYLGAHASLADYMQELTKETIAVPTTLRYYIDWQAMARDAELNGDLFAICTTWDVAHVFAGC